MTELSKLQGRTLGRAQAQAGGAGQRHADRPCRPAGAATMSRHAFLLFQAQTVQESSSCFR